jgi:ABC-type sugar transport system ATPase subunit
MDPSRAESLSAHVGHPLVLGLRPHTLHLDPGPAGGAPSRAGLNATVRTVEPLGDAMDVSATLETGHRIVARVPAREGVEPGARILFHVDMSQAHVFEPGDFGVRL